MISNLPSAELGLEVLGTPARPQGSLNVTGSLDGYSGPVELWSTVVVPNSMATWEHRFDPRDPKTGLVHQVNVGSDPSVPQFTTVNSPHCISLDLAVPSAASVIEAVIKGDYSGLAPASSGGIGEAQKSGKVARMEPFYVGSRDINFASLGWMTRTAQTITTVMRQGLKLPYDQPSRFVFDDGGVFFGTKRDAFEAILSNSLSPADPRIREVGVHPFASPSVSVLMANQVAIPIVDPSTRRAMRVTGFGFDAVPFQPGVVFRPDQLPVAVLMTEPGKDGSTIFTLMNTAKPDIFVNLYSSAIGAALVEQHMLTTGLNAEQMAAMMTSMSPVDQQAMTNSVRGMMEKAPDMIRAAYTAELAMMPAIVLETPVEPQYYHNVSAVAAGQKLSDVLSRSRILEISS